MTDPTTLHSAQHTIPHATTTLDEHGVRTWHALQERSAWFELPEVCWLSFSGEKAAEAVNGLVTNDVASLAPGCGQYAAALTPKGKIAADLVIVREGDGELLAGTNSAAFPGWWEIVRKYVNPRLAKYRDERESLSTFAVFGKGATQFLAVLGGGSAEDGTMAQALTAVLDGYSDWQHGRWNLGPLSVRLLRVPLLGNVPGFLLISDASDRAVLRKRLSRYGGLEGSAAALDVARIEAGQPKWGVDMDESSLAQEANLDDLSAISFEKGCYTGQETVARVHFRGHVNRFLRGLESQEPLPPRAQVLNADGKVVGDVRSSGVSPGRGPVALAMLRREVAAGDAVRVSLPDGREAPATVRVLPFTTSVVPAG